jgi:hypothetical protein
MYCPLRDLSIFTASSAEDKVLLIERTRSPKVRTLGSTVGMMGNNFRRVCLQVKPDW